jgi:hypothetical protein
MAFEKRNILTTDLFISFLYHFIRLHSSTFRLEIKMKKNGWIFFGKAGEFFCAFGTSNFFLQFDLFRIIGTSTLP